MKAKHQLNITVKSQDVIPEYDVWCEIERSSDSVILMTGGKGKGTYPILLDLKAAGIEGSWHRVAYEACPAEVQAIAVRLDDPRIDYDREDVDAWIAGELDDPEDGGKTRVELETEKREDTRKAKNAFLKQKGYAWKKKNVYLYDQGDTASGWMLVAPDGSIVIDAVASICGQEVVQTGDFEDIITDLGYYGEEAIDAMHEEKAARQKCIEARETLDAYFNNASAHDVDPPANPRLDLINLGGTARYAIDADGVWHLRAQEDGTWANYRGYFAVRYDLNSEVVEAIKLLQAWIESNA